MPRFTMCLSILVVLAALTGAGVYAFRNLGRWLIIRDPLPEHVDVLFTFAWDYKRVEYAEVLAKKYPGALLVFSDPDNRFYSRIQEKTTIDTSRVVTLTGCESTFDEVEVLHAYLTDPDTIPDRIGFYANHNTTLHTRDRLVIGMVSSPWHMRRIKISAWKVFKGKKYDIKYFGAPLGDYKITEKHISNWWKEDEEYKKRCINELIKSLYYSVFLH